MPALRKISHSLSVICNTGKFSKSSGKTLPCRGGFIPPVSIATQSSCGGCRPRSSDGRDKPAPTLRLLDLGIGYRIEIHSLCTLSSFPRESRSYCPNFLRNYQYCRVGIARTAAIIVSTYDRPDDESYRKRLIAKCRKFPNQLKLLFF